MSKREVPVPMLLVATAVAVILCAIFMSSRHYLSHEETRGLQLDQRLEAAQKDRSAYDAIQVTGP